MYLFWTTSDRYIYVYTITSLTSISNSIDLYNIPITVTSQWARWHLKSSASPLFTAPFIQTQITETSKLCVTVLCGGNSPVTGEFPVWMASNAEMFPFDDVISILWDLLCVVVFIHDVCNNLGPFYWPRLTDIRAWIDNYIHSFHGM